MEKSKIKCAKTSHPNKGQTKNSTRFCHFGIVVPKKVRMSYVKKRLIEMWVKGEIEIDED
jgi:hypothetical protein